MKARLYLPDGTLHLVEDDHGKVMRLEEHEHGVVLAVGAESELRRQKEEVFRRLGNDFRRLPSPDDVRVLIDGIRTRPVL